MEDSRSRERFSMPTYTEPRPKQISSMKSVFVLSFLFTFILLIIMFSCQESQEKQQSSENQNKKDKSFDKNELVIFDNSTLNQLDLVKVLIELEQSKTYQECLQSSLQTIKVFSQIKKFNYSDLSLQKYMRKIYLFEVVKHKKLTTPKNIQANWYDSFNPFFKPDLYENVENIFSQSAQKEFVWRSSGNYITFFSVTPIQVSLIKIEIQMEQIQEKSLYLIGISAYDTIITNQHTLQSEFIEKFHVANGLNFLECKNPSCQRDYSLIMIHLEPIEIRKLEIYTKNN